MEVEVAKGGAESLRLLAGLASSCTLLAKSLVGSGFVAGVVVDWLLVRPFTSFMVSGDSNARTIAALWKLEVMVSGSISLVVRLHMGLARLLFEVAGWLSNFPLCWETCNS